MHIYYVYHVEKQLKCILGMRNTTMGICAQCLS